MWKYSLPRVKQNTGLPLLFLLHSYSVLFWSNGFLHFYFLNLVIFSMFAKPVNNKTKILTCQNEWELCGLLLYVQEIACSLYDDTHTIGMDWYTKAIIEQIYAYIVQALKMLIFLVALLVRFLFLNECATNLLLLSFNCASL